jgi:probable HAF family extracellular repeat protein
VKAQNLASFQANRRLLAVALSMGFVYALTVNPALALPRYSITDIGFGGSDINNKGQVAGSGTSPATQGKVHAYRYTDGVGQEDLGTLFDVLPGIEPKYVPLDTHGYAINDAGQMVGQGGKYGFRYTDGVGMENLTASYCNPSNSTIDYSCQGRAVDINNIGQVIGDEFGIDTVQHKRAVRYTDGFTKAIYFDVAAVRDSASFGFGINDVGQSVGFSSDTLDIKHAFRITDGFGMEYLGSLGGSIQSGGEYSWGENASAAYGINNKGQVVGKSSTSSLRWHGFLYTDNIGMQDLGVLQGDDSSEGLELNDSGQVVGRSWSTNGGRSHSVLWTQPGCPEDLNLASGVMESGWILADAQSINNKGQIVGSGINPAGESHGYRLTPVAAGGAPQCAATAPVPIPGTTPPGSGTPPPTGSSTTIEPAFWKTVKPSQPCTTKACKTKLAKNRELLKAKATMAMKTQRAAEKAKSNLGKQAVAIKARRQFDRAVVMVQNLHN